MIRLVRDESSPRRRGTQRRGDERRVRLLRAVRRLLEREELAALTYAAVCVEAGLPSGSARHFYRDLDELLCALAVELGKQHDAWLMRPVRRRDTRSWRALHHCLIERSARFQRDNPIYAKLTISGATPPDLKELDRIADRSRAELFLALLEEHFVLPRIPDREQIVYFAIEIVDLAFTLSFRESGHVTREWVQYAKTASEAYMVRYFGEELLPRPTSPSVRRRSSQRRTRPLDAASP